jgi:hypothetical protein
MTKKTMSDQKDTQKTGVHSYGHNGVSNEISLHMSSQTKRQKSWLQLCI